MFTRPLQYICLFAVLACGVSFFALTVDAEKHADLKEKPAIEKTQFMKREMLPPRRV